MARNKFDVDETLERKFDFSKLKRALVYVKPFTKPMLLALLLSAAASMLSLAAPSFLQQAMDIAIPNADRPMLWRLGAMTLGVILISSVFGALRGIIMSKVGQSIVYNIRHDLFAHLQQLPFAYYDSRPHGKILVRVVNYVNSVSDTISNGIINAVIDLLNIVFIAFYMFMVDAQLSLIILAGLPVLLAIIFLLKNAQKRACFAFNNKNSNLTAYTCESIEGVKVSQIFNRQDENMSIYEQLNVIYQKAWYHMCLYINLLSPTSELIKQIVVAAVYVCGILVVKPSVEVGVLIAMATYASRFWQPIISLANIYNNFLTTISYLERIFQTLDEPVDICDAPDAKPIEQMHGDIEFKNVSFEYEKGLRILKNVSFSARSGESIALVGPTGSGKSTIVNLISRFYNVTDGTLLIDGVDINKITIKSLRSNMGIMLQDSFIFSGSIADNIRYGRLDATDEQVRSAARAVCADEFISALPRGYNTVVNERGGQLSQGQRQLIAFARTMLSDPAVLILDEATSSIDARTEQLLQKGIEALMRGRTSFVIAHRLSTIKSSDKIMVIKSGEIAECGTHEQLMNQKGEYYRLNTEK